MAACSEVEEKPSSPKEPLPLKIFVDNAVNHEMRKNCFNDLKRISKNHDSSSELTKKTEADDLKTLSDVDFINLLEEASNFTNPPEKESVLLKQLKKEIFVTDSSGNVKSDSHDYIDSKIFSNTNGLQTRPYESTYIPPVSQRTKKSRHNKSDRKAILSAKALEKTPNISQSMNDLSSDLESNLKSRKSHRTLSLSSEEAIGIVSDSCVTSKSNKKSHKQSLSNSSKNELNKTSKVGSKVSPSSEFVFTSENEDANIKGFHTCVQSEGLPYQPFMNTADIPLPPSRKNSGSEKGSSDSKSEIEMAEIKSNKESKNERTSNKELRIVNGPNESNSKFYVDCNNDVDATVSFPLKLTPVDDQSSEVMPEILKRQLAFPLSPWPRPLQVNSFYTPGQYETEPFNPKNDKQLQDINGNPFVRPTRPSSLASFVSTTFLDYNNSGLISEPKNRKNKRAKNSLNKVVLSESIAGYRGKEDIDTLLEYINSSDKKNKSAVKSSQNQLISNKNSMFHDHDRKKSIGKEFKNCHKNMINTVKKKLTRSNSLENITAHNEISDEIQFSYEAGDTRSESVLKKSANFENSVSKNLDINSNVENQLTYINYKGKDSSSTDESSSQNMDHSSPEVSSFAADFYSTADVSSQTTEESGFLIVKKKQRKKQSKRSDTYRWRNAQAQRKKGIMLPLAESKCGKQDSRRKSTSSVPHSEHSSADNSDLDSVHSLPVRGSVPHPTKPHPHTTPSSSSSTPQASYADIARMPISKLNSHSPCIITYSAHNSVKQQSGEQEMKQENSPVTAFPLPKRRVSDSKESSTPSNKGTSHTSVVGEENDNSSEVKVRIYTKSTREINTQTEPQGTNIAENSKVETSSLKEEDVKQLCNTCSLLKKECSCLKAQPSFRQKAKSLDIPPVIMDNIPPDSNTCNVSFGFGIEEVLQMTPSDNLPPCPITVNLASDLERVYLENPCSSEKCDNKNSEITVKHEPISDINLDSSFKISSLADESKTILSSDLSCEQSSHIKTISYGSGKSIRYSETKVNVKKFNLSEIANFLGNEFQSIEKEIKGINRNKSNARMMYYTDSVDEV